MGQYTTRHLKGLNVSCDGALNAGGGGFDVYIYGLELLRPNGSAFTLDAFDKAWPGKAQIWGWLGSSVEAVSGLSQLHACADRCNAEQRRAG